MRILQINSCNFGSTGNIMLNLAKISEKHGHEVYKAFPKRRSNRSTDGKSIVIGGIFSRNLHLILSKMTGFNGCFSILSTALFLKKVKKIRPDIIHLHNLHNCYINLPMLFSYIKKHNIKTVWTLHDCWAFTGHCPHFTVEKCDKWKTGCFACCQYRSYPASYVDRSTIMYKLKRKWFTGIKRMTIITPSEWLADLVRQSFLKEYDVKVINNGIDLSVFKPTAGTLEKYGLENKHIILGVAMPWSERKGLDVFLKLAKMFDDTYRIVLVGIDEEQKKTLPNNVVGILRTANREELAEIYSAADVFANPTKEEVLGMVNLEALACGTPVVTFKTGGSPECIDSSCGIVTPCDDIDEFVKAIRTVCEEKPFGKDECVKRAKLFDMNAKFEEYVSLYERL